MKFFLPLSTKRPKYIVCVYCVCVRGVESLVNTNYFTVMRFLTMKAQHQL